MKREDWRPVVKAFKDYPQYWEQGEFRCVFTPLGYEIWTANGLFFIKPMSGDMYDFENYRYGAWGKIRVYLAWKSWKWKHGVSAPKSERREAQQLSEFVTRKEQP